MPDVMELLKKVRRIEIVANRTVNDLFVGQYKSVFRGRGMEFSEVREYQPGDDIRSIDWNVTARAGKPFIKRFVEERELTILFLMDISASGIFGSAVSKIDTAVEIAATLMFSALKNNDKVGLVTFADKVIDFYRPRKGKANVLHLIRELLTVEPTGKRTDMQAALDYVNRVQKRRAVVFLLSDFFVPEIMESALETEPNQNLEKMLEQIRQRDTVIFRPNRKQQHRKTTASERSLSICARKHDLVAMTLVDPREETFPSVGFITLQDAETGEILELDTANPQVRERLAKRFRSGQDQISETLKRCRIDQLRIETGSDFLVNLRRFFHNREKRR
jgi:uncharacterized protein (DUF58 family)